MDEFKEVEEELRCLFTRVPLTIDDAKLLRMQCLMEEANVVLHLPEFEIFDNEFDIARSQRSHNRKVEWLKCLLREAKQIMSQQ
jgi:hypothetical protein